jgi:hypothetical protein
MTKRPINPDAQAAYRASGSGTVDEVWANDEYECQVRYQGNGRDGALHLSIKRHDRGPARDFRHLMAIKNTVCGEEREGVELYPAESRLVDGANQTHLFVMPVGVEIPIGFRERVVATPEEARAAVEAFGLDGDKLGQRPWQPGLPTGRYYRPRGAR